MKKASSGRATQRLTVTVAMITAVVTGVLFRYWADTSWLMGVIFGIVMFGVVVYVTPRYIIGSDTSEQQ